MIRCPCCNCLTIDDYMHPIVEICEVCYWQYDEVAQEKPDEVIGPNHICLNEAILNYRKYGAIDKKYVDYVRKPYKYELPQY
ncbi:MAG: glycosyltransferase [Lachnospiraceae bacterium]|nr:glycosyltransferase [Lachnospiraceae bacterium]